MKMVEAKLGRQFLVVALKSTETAAVAIIDQTSIAVDIPQFLFHLLPWCYPARISERTGSKEKPAISLRQRALFWLRESDLN
jgi:hypothetical protein